jgi:hypothetical protein
MDEVRIIGGVKVRGRKTVFGGKLGPNGDGGGTPGRA